MNNDENQEKLLTIEKAAEYLNVSQGTVRNLIERGNLVPVRMCDRIVRISQLDIDDFIRTSRDDSRKH